MTIEELLEAQRTGDHEAIILAHINMSKKIARRFITMFPYLEDEIKSASLWGLLRGVKSFKHRGLACSGYLKMAIENQIRSAITGYKFVSYDFEGGYEPDDEVVANDLIDKMRMTKEEHQIVLLRMEGYSNTAIAEIVGLSLTTLQVRTASIIRKWRLIC